MDVSDLLVELFDRIPPLVRSATEDLDAEQLAAPPASGANTVGWLLWHLARVQDHHLADVLEQDQVWVTSNWAERFGLEPDPGNTGYGHSTDEVLSVRPQGAEAIVEYFDAVSSRTGAYLRGLTAEDLDRIVDEDWDPPVTLGARLVSVANDDLEHAGQAAYARGMLLNR